MPILFLVTITLGSGLLFLVQPMSARFLLPLLGGTPAVWTTCMLFFQAGLLAGYGYTHALPRLVGHRPHAWLHLLLLTAAVFLLPIAMPTEAPPMNWPVPWLLGTLLVTVGLPYVLLASNAPLLQRWFAFQDPQRDPYFLYAASNLGSFAGLLAYPFLFEPRLSLPDQADAWRWGFVGLTVLMALCALPLLNRETASAREMSTASDRDTPDLWQRTRWVLLALVPSSLLLSVTTYLTSDIAPLPLFWVVPLGLYLLTFVVAFAKHELIPRAALVRWSPLAVIVIALVLLRGATAPVALVLGLHVLSFTMLALLCHGELARARPAVEHLTGFYFCLALGGVLGGLLNGVVAPLLFNGYLEYPLMLVAALLLRPRPADLGQGRVPPPWRGAGRLDLVWPALVGVAAVALILGVRHFDVQPSEIAFAIAFVPPLVATYLFQERPVRLGLAVAAVLLASRLYPSEYGRTLYQERSFFGVHKVVQKENRRSLFHGNTLHGSQDQSPGQRREPQTYYSRSGPVGFMLKGYRGQERRRNVAVVGLGTGSIAAYAERGERWSFLEIDPVVIRIARDRGDFTFLADAKAAGADIQVTLGDGRLALRDLCGLGVLILDAFGSDAIPTHLLTREAFLEYRRSMRDDGVILMNISNRYVDLEPVLAALAADLGWHCLIWEDNRVTPQQGKMGKTPSVWAALSWVDPLAGLEAHGSDWRSARSRPGIPAWRDDYANLLPLIRWSDE